ncbi:WSC domain containing protein [Nitzschia inconspicua]|uniref:WSC domain containing protein n=1 Tax=Nitzschia inconspicua TaxID=303405 RepID=A0A9K3PTH5_9STRA|nr:WSC domain containing protein [Nitzschia inconspicua]KAG7358856.1 WSC domain containing protein [Nitzschia inconspicua]
MDANRPVPVFSAGLYTHPETEAVFVAGSTAGVGEAFGEVSRTTNDVDAFIFQLDKNLNICSYRLGTAGQDYIISQCSPVEETALMEGDKFQNTDPRLAKAWYVVGVTSSSFFKADEEYVQGDGAALVYRAFISKIDLDVMKEEWTVELAAPPGTVVDAVTGDVSSNSGDASETLSSSQAPAREPSDPPENPTAPFSDSFLGCWFDDTGTRSMDIEGKSGSIEACIVFCRDYKSEDHGYPFAALQYGKVCFCGFQYDRYGKATEEDCNYPCAIGEGFCGGVNRNSVYSTGATDLLTQSPSEVPILSSTVRPEPVPTPVESEEPVLDPTGPPQ